MPVIKYAFYKISLIFIFFIPMLTSAQNKKNIYSEKNVVRKSAAYKYIIIKSGQNRFGYNILSGHHIIIHQPNIPAIAGNRGFAKKQDAEKTAKLAITKLENHIMPPTISIYELDSMHINIYHPK